MKKSVFLKIIFIFGFFFLGTLVLIGDMGNDCIITKNQEIEFFEVYSKENYGAKTMQSGIYINTFSKEESRRFYECANDAEGYAVVIKKDKFDLDRFCEDMGVLIITSRELDGRVIMDCYTNKIKGFIISNGEKINLQISISSEYAKVGTPLIYGGF